MNNTWENKLELFAKNVQIMKSEFVWQNVSIKRMAALLYALEGKTVDLETIRQCHNLIKQNTGAFSTFRGSMALGLATMLSLSGNPENSLSATLKVYKLLKDVKFRASYLLVVAAYRIAIQADASDYENAVMRTRAFFAGMKAKNFFYTGQDDYIFAAMLGLSGLDLAEGTERILQIYNQLKREFRNKNSIQILAQVLALGEADDSIINRVLALRDALRTQKIKLDKAYTLPFLGIFALLPVEIEIIVNKIGEAQDALRNKKGFRTLSVSTGELLLFAATIVASDYTENIKDGVLTATLSTCIANIIIAQEAAMVAAASSSSSF